MSSRSRWAIVGMACACFCASGWAMQIVRAAVPPEGRQNQADQGDRPRRGPMGGPRAHDGPPPGGRMEGEPRRPFKERHGEGPDGDRRRMDRPHDLSPEMLDNVMALIGEKFPTMHERLSNLRERNPERFKMAIGRMVGVYHEYQMLKERQPEFAENLIEEIRGEERLGALSEEYKAAAGDAPKLAQVEASIREVVRAQISLKLKRHEARLADFAARITQQQERLAEEQARLVEEKSRIEELVSERVEDIKAGKMRPMRGPFEGRGRGPGFGGPGREGPGGPDGPGFGNPEERRQRMRDGKGPRHPRPRPDDDGMRPYEEDGDRLPPPPPPPEE